MSIERFLLDSVSSQLPLTDTIINISPIDNKDICTESESKPTNQTKPNQSNDSESYVNSAVNNRTDKDCFIVIDNIPSPKRFRSYVEIRKEIKKFPELDKPKHSFSLPKGGIALQYEDKCSAEKSLKSWPKEAFGSESLPHKAIGKKEIKTGFVKNISPSIPVKDIEKVFKENCSVILVSRLHYRHSRKPMPIVKIEFGTVEDLKKANSVVLEF